MRCRVATICQSRRFYPTVEANRNYVLGLLDAALLHKPDLVCLPETFTTASVPAEALTLLAEPLDGPTLNAVAQRARRHATYILCPIVTRQDGVVFNSAALIDRAGAVMGVYNKRQPVTTSGDYTEFERGTQPGGALPVFDCDFGRIGVQICFDILFPEDWLELARRDVRLVVWASAYNGGRAMEMQALLHHYYVVTAVSTDKARIIDPCGTTLAQTDSLRNIVIRDINLDFAVCHYDFNYAIPDRILAAYPGRVEIRSHPDDGMFLVEPTDPALTIERLQKEFGFETGRVYQERHRKAYACIRQGESPPPQWAAHGSRPMYGKE